MKTQPLTARKQYCLAVPKVRDNKATSPTRKTLWASLNNNNQTKAITMKINDLILDKLKESEGFRLIAAKENILNEAIHSLVGHTTDIEEYLYIFNEIERSFSLDDELESKLTVLNNELKNTDDFKVPLTIEIEELCQKIRELGPSEDTQVSIWTEQIALNHLYLSENISFEELFNRLTNYIYNNEKDFFARNISYYSQNEKVKERLIEQLEKELIPIKNVSENLLMIEEIDNNWGSQLQEISCTQAYNNNFYHFFEKEKEAILLKNSIGLNELEKLELNAFFEELEIKLG